MIQEAQFKKPISTKKMKKILKKKYSKKKLKKKKVRKVSFRTYRSKEPIGTDTCKKNRKFKKNFKKN